MCGDVTCGVGFFLWCPYCIVRTEDNMYSTYVIQFCIWSDATCRGSRLWEGQPSGNGAWLSWRMEGQQCLHSQAHHPAYSCSVCTARTDGPFCIVPLQYASYIKIPRLCCLDRYNCTVPGTGLGLRTATPALPLGSLFPSSHSTGTDRHWR
jgi:hypothetical protein